jgi:rubrerythrin
MARALDVVKMWVCSACGGVWFPAVAEAHGRCPSCKGQGAVQDCTRDEAGVVKPVVK